MLVCNYSSKEMEMKNLVYIWCGVFTLHCVYGMELQPVIRTKDGEIRAYQQQSIEPYIISIKQQSLLIQDMYAYISKEEGPEESNELFVPGVTTYQMMHFISYLGDKSLLQSQKDRFDALCVADYLNIEAVQKDIARGFLDVIKNNETLTTLIKNNDCGILPDAVSQNLVDYIKKYYPINLALSSKTQTFEDIGYILDKALFGLMQQPLFMTGLAYSHDGQWLAVSYDMQVFFKYIGPWRMPSFFAPPQLNFFSPVCHVCFNRSNNNLIIGTHNSVIVYECGSWKKLQTIQSPGYALATSPDGNYLYSANQNSICRYVWKERYELTQEIAYPGATCLAINCNGTSLAAANATGIDIIDLTRETFLTAQSLQFLSASGKQVLRALEAQGLLEEFFKQNDMYAFLDRHRVLELLDLPEKIAFGPAIHFGIDMAKKTLHVYHHNTKIAEHSMGKKFEYTKYSCIRVHPDRTHIAISTPSDEIMNLWLVDVRALKAYEMFLSSKQSLQQALVSIGLLQGLDHELLNHLSVEERESIAAEFLPIISPDTRGFFAEQLRKNSMMRAIVLYLHKYWA
jgi:hypothetical protein